MRDRQVGGGDVYSPLSIPFSVGARGEATASLLVAYGKKPISTIAPKAFADKFATKDSLIAHQHSLALADAVNQWLQYLEVAESVRVEDRGQAGLAVLVRLMNSDGFRDIGNVGVGVSQVLPIVVQCLLAPAPCTILLEQPELHLHPAVQAKLADFLIAATISGRQCIVESHGEYLVERLRLRVAESMGTTLLEQLRIFFIERTKDGSRPRQVHLSEFGKVIDWPDGFFDQAQNERRKILHAATEKLKAQRVRGKRND